MDGLHVVPVDPFRPHRVGGGAVDHVAGRGSLMVGGGHGILVVLAHEKYRQLPQSGHVEALVEDALAQRAIAEEDHGHTGLMLQALVEGAADGDRDGAGGDAVGAHEADVADGHVLAAAATARVAARTAEDLCHHPPRIGAARQQMAVPAVVAVDEVVVAQGGTDAHRAGFLSDTQVGGSGHDSLEKQLVQARLESPDEAHLLVGGAQLIGIQGRFSFRLGGKLEAYAP